jgi:hypothetical protein
VQGQIPTSLSNLYHSMFSSECGTGLQLAEYSTLNELFGTAEMENRFQPENIFVGDWSDVNQSQSVIHGKVGRRVFSMDGLEYAQQGSRMLIGLPGYIGSLYDESHLDDKTNRNENFIVVDASEAAAQALVSRGGLLKYLDYLKTIWKLTSTLSSEELQGLQTLANEGKLQSADIRSITQAMPPPVLDRRDKPDASATALQVAEMLSDPFLNETKVYVHPIGVKPISWHILRLARVNSRTPYGVSFYAEATHGEIFDRWLDLQLQSCGQ